MPARPSPDLSPALRPLLEGLVADGALTGGAVAVIREGSTMVVTAGFADLERHVPLRGDAQFRLASVTKPIIAALGLRLVEDGVLALDDPIDRWMPELASPAVLSAAGDGPTPARGPVRVRHLLDSTCGWGFPGDLSLPGVAAMLAAVGDGRHRDRMPAPDAWVAALAGVPLLFEPGERWLYDTSYDLLGVVLSRAAGDSLPVVLRERLLEPLGMRRTGFATHAEGTKLVQAVRWGAGALEDAGQADRDAEPAFASGAGGLIGTLDDLVRFARMLLDDGRSGGVQVLSQSSVHAMTTDRLTGAQRAQGGGFLDGQSWGYGGCVDVDVFEPWQALGRFGWTGVSGTSLHVRQDVGSAVVVLTSRELFEAEDTAILEAIWAAAA